MNMYQYVAVSNPSMAKAICHKYGYQLSNVKNPKDLGVCLEQLVNQEGESALKDIILNHPDRELIIEMCGKESVGFMGADGSNSKSCNCGCGGSCKQAAGAYAGYVNFTGKQDENVGRIASSSNNAIIAAAFLLGIALLATKM